MTTLANNYLALARYVGTLDKEGHDAGAAATVAAVARLGWLDKTRAALVRGVLTRHRKDELAWLFGPEGQKLGFSLTMDTQPDLLIAPLTWALMRGKSKLMAELGHLGARFESVGPEDTHPLIHLINERAGAMDQVPLALLDQAQALGLSFQGGRDLLLGHVFTRRSLQPHGLPTHSPERGRGRIQGKKPGAPHDGRAPALLGALDWAEALVARGADPLACDSSGFTLHHRVLYWETHQGHDDRRPWLAFLERHQALVWDQPDRWGRTPRQMQANQHPHMEAEFRAELAKTESLPERRRARVRS